MFDGDDQSACGWSVWLMRMRACRDTFLRHLKVPASSKYPTLSHPDLCFPGTACNARIPSTCHLSIPISPLTELTHNIWKSRNAHFLQRVIGPEMADISYVANSTAVVHVSTHSAQVHEALSRHGHGLKSTTGICRSIVGDGEVPSQSGQLMRSSRSVLRHVEATSHVYRLDNTHVDRALGTRTCLQLASM